MSLIDLVTQAGGGQALNQIGARVGLTPEQVNAAVIALGPAIASGLAQHARSGDLSATLNTATAAPAQDAAIDQGNAILGQIFGTRDVSRGVADHASAQTGIDSAQLRALLPMLVTLAASSLASHAQAGAPGASAPASPLPGAPAGGNAAAGALGAAGVQILVGMLDRDGDGSPLNDIMRMGGALFRRN